MNIQEAKEEICRTVLAYTRKNEDGSYRIPAVKQRPVLLIGPPGIGKTAIMEQAAQECGVGLVAYTITHHTRQSAIGLPVIREKNYGGTSCSVTEYTMSEIIASVYECMEKTGKREGILFIDEINCVSETLAPAMLQFLQCKTFGSHQVPEGWVIAAAGNPPGYNKSVREFDVVTLDRVRLITIEENLPVWKQFARKAGVHEAILSFLEIKPQDFYRMEAFEEGKYFVTARGWEDLSRMLQVYEELDLPVSAAFVQEFLQYPMAARDFAAYYALYRKYESDYQIPGILSGSFDPEISDRAKAASYEERITLVHLLFEALLERTNEKMPWRNAFVFLENCFGRETELRLFIEEIQKSARCMEFLENCGLEEFKEICRYYRQQEKEWRAGENSRELFRILERGDC
ncbi:MAG: AAA family ATPase [Lachnospiraceae bacterium]|nr:AAA family ATPase [Lachnospiraceae bacterium]